MNLLVALRRLAPLALGVLALALAVQSAQNNVSALFDPRAVAVTLLLPWLALAVTDSWGSALAVAQDFVTADPALLPQGRRRASAQRLDTLGSMSLAAGVIAAFLTFVANLNEIASTSGQPSGNGWIGLTAGLLLGPIYGLLLKALLYDPAATALRATQTELAEWLEDDPRP